MGAAFPEPCVEAYPRWVCDAILATSGVIAWLPILMIWGLLL